MLAGGGTMEAGAESGAKEVKGGMMEASAMKQLLSIYIFTDILKNYIFRKASSVNHYLRTSYLPSSGNARNQTKKQMVFCSLTEKASQLCCVHVVVFYHISTRPSCFLKILLLLQKYLLCIRYLFTRFGEILCIMLYTGRKTKIHETLIGPKVLIWSVLF